MIVARRTRTYAYACLMVVAVCAPVSAHAQWRPAAEFPTWVHEIFFINPDTGWVATGAGLFRTFDGGAHWDSLPSAAPYAFGRIDCVDTAHCWTGTRFGTLYRTSDGGRTWTDLTGAFPEHRPDGTTEFVVTDVHFFDPDTGVAVGNFVSLLRTTDGGETWEFRNVDWAPRGYHIQFEDVAFADRMHGVAVGGNNATIMAYTTDGGLTWGGDLREFQGNGGNTHYVSMPDRRHAFTIDESGYLYVTNDGGTIWQHTRPDTWTCVEVAFVDSLRGWMCADRNSDPLPGELRFTSDGGDTWVTEFKSPLHFTTVYVGPGGVCWAGARDGSLLRRDDMINSAPHTTRSPDHAAPNVVIAWHSGREVILAHYVGVRHDIVLELYDVLGRRVSRSRGTAQHDAPLELETGSHPNGTYVWSVSVDGVIHTGHVVIRR